MKISCYVGLVVLLALTGCRISEVIAAEEQHAEHGAVATQAGDSEEEASIKESMAKLAPKDRELAAAQGYCPVLADNRLGAMGPPIKVMVKDQPVFLCCAGCRKRAMADPDNTLAVVKELQAKVEAAEVEASLAKLSPEDRQQAEAQGFCPVMEESRLGAMGVPVKIMVNNEPVFLCCAGCRTKALANSDKTLATVAKLQDQVTKAAEQEKR